MPLNDVTPYMKYVEHFDLSEAQKVELIHNLWNIMESFADIAFGLHPAQLCEHHQHDSGSHSLPERVPLVMEQ